MNDLQVRAQKIGVYAKYGGLALITVLLLPILYLIGLAVATAAAIGAATTVAIAVTVLGGIALVQLLPWFQMKMENLALKLMKAEARKNPVETAQNKVRKESAALDAYVAETKERLAKGNAMVADTLEMAKTDPEGAAAFQQNIENFQREMAIRQNNIRNRTEALKKSKEKVARAARRWEYMKKHSSFKNVTEEQQALNEIVMEEALDEINAADHRNMANLEVDNFVAELKQEQAPKAAVAELTSDNRAFLSNLKPFDMGDVLDVQVKQKVIAQ